ncbi:hypothetical protein [Izhakiella capsodis]|uniref:hypothetical protein n=1 Tax=Izhakiella capsodis TaxID=1367852 RepID=UPI0011603CD0|nr:hypothetical protein [Izhakiella capsodis]
MIVLRQTSDILVSGEQRYGYVERFLGIDQSPYVPDNTTRNRSTADASAVSKAKLSGDEKHLTVVSLSKFTEYFCDYIEQKCGEHGRETGYQNSASLKNFCHATESLLSVA